MCKLQPHPGNLCHVSWNLLCSVVLFCTLAIPVSGCHSPEVTPERGGPRIVSLTPSVTETLFAIGVGFQVVGVSEYCDFPPQARRLPKIGSFLTPNVEAIVALRPTLVIGLLTSSDLREIRALQSLGIATLMVDDGSVAAIETSIARIGDAVGKPRAAAALIAQIKASIGRIEERLSTIRPRSVLMVVGHQPLVAVGPGTYLDELLTLADAHNIAGFSTQPWPRLSLEYIVASRPEVILDGQMGTDLNAPARFWTRYPSIPAVREHRVFGYPDNPTLHPGPRTAQSLELLARLIHPEAFGVAQRAPSHQAQ